MEWEAAPSLNVLGHPLAPYREALSGLGVTASTDVLGLPHGERARASRAYCLRKRAEGKAHRQAVIALARRRVNVLWAMLRYGRPYVEQPVRAA
jgi:hypothetical protein